MLILEDLMATKSLNGFESSKLQKLILHCRWQTGAYTHSRLAASEIQTKCSFTAFGCLWVLPFPAYILSCRSLGDWWSDLQHGMYIRSAQDVDNNDT